MIADIAVIFHWPLSDMVNMSLDELADWHERAVERSGNNN